MSHAIANALVSNDDHAATIEMTLYGGRYRAECPLGLALAGAPMLATIQGADGIERPVSIPGAFPLRVGEQLNISGCESGARTYLATRGGFLSECVLGSRCRSAPLRPGELVPANASTTLVHRIRPGHPTATTVVRVLEGPDARSCPLDSWIGQEWRVGPHCDRLGVRLEGPERIPCAARTDGRSVPVAPGTVQVAGGYPMILGPACGTMGGYPIAAVVISADLAKVGRLRPGERVRFVPVTLTEARRLDDDVRRQLDSYCERLRRRVEMGGRQGVGE